MSKLLNAYSQHPEWLLGVGTETEREFLKQNVQERNFANLAENQRNGEKIGLRNEKLNEHLSGGIKVPENQLLVDWIKCSTYSFE